MSRPLRWFDVFTINIYFMGLTTLSQTMTPLVMPLLVQQFVGEARQGTMYGNLRLWTLMVALLVQALMGMLSDRSTHKWGRRRPFIFAGTVADLVFIAAIGFTAGLEGMAGYWLLFVLLILLMVSSNTAHGAVQGLIPDLVPENKRGVFSGVKAILEVPVPVILVSFTVARLIANGNLWGGLLVAMGLLTLSMVITMFAPEKKLEGTPPPLDWTPFVRLLLMTAAFTLVILGLGQFTAWVSRMLTGSTMPVALIAMGFLGVIGMILAVAMGVWISVKLSLGEKSGENPSFTWWVINRLAYLVGSTNIASFAVYYLQGRLGLQREEAAGPAAQLIMFVGLFILILGLPGGWLADKFGRRPLVAFSCIVAATGALILVLAPNMTIIYLGAILVGAATGVFYTANWALGTDLVPKSEAGRYLGISNLAGAGAGAVGAYIGGPIADYFTVNFSQSPGLGYVLLFAIYIGLFLFALFALKNVNPTKQIV